MQINGQPNVQNFIIYKSITKNIIKLLKWFRPKNGQKAYRI